jgi:large subunit ribosomal protein L15
MANELSNLKPAPGERRARKRVGRGEGSGKGKTAGRGTKGAQSRSGYSHRPGFEGGQMPLHRRLPKKGFRSPFAKDYTEFNVGGLAGLDAGTVVTHDFMHSTRLVSRVGSNGIKILGRGDLAVALHVRVAKFSKSAAEKIVAAGGTIEGPLPE